MKNNTKKASVKFFLRSVIFSAFYADFCFCPKSVIITTLTNSVDPDQTPRLAAFDLGLHCLHMPIYGALSVKWIE